MTLRRLTRAAATIAACGAAAALMAACGASSSSDMSQGPGTKPIVAISVAPLADIARNVAGGEARVVQLIPDGTDSHTYEPSPQNAKDLERADVVFLNGLHLEQPTLDLARANARSGSEIVLMGERTIAPSRYKYDFSFPRSGGDPNPHLWMNPLYAERYSEIIADTLARRFPAHAATFRRNQTAFAERVRALDAAIRTSTATIPPANRKLVTYHDSFAYFAPRYGLTVIGAVQPADFSEPTPGEVPGDHRSGQARGRAGHLRQRGVPLHRAGRGGERVGRSVRRQAPRRRPARGRGCSEPHLPGPDAGRRGDHDQRPRGRSRGHPRREGGRCLPLSRASAAVSCRGLTCAYRHDPVLEDVSLELAPGELAAVVGPSGAGKTTLLRALVGQVRPVGGQVLVDGRPPGRRSARVGYVPQVDSVDWSFPVTVREVVWLGRAAESGPWPWPRRQDRRDCDDLLERLGLSGLGGRHIRELSGGQQQRTFLARALFRRPGLLLLDEPTSGVDVATKREILNLLVELNAEGTTVVLTTHDLNGVAAHLPRLVCVNRTLVADGPPHDVFTPSVLLRTFGAEMVVFRHGEMLLTAEAPGHRLDHTHHLHDDGHAHAVPAGRAG